MELFDSIKNVQRPLQIIPVPLTFTQSDLNNSNELVLNHTYWISEVCSLELFDNIGVKRPADAIFKIISNKQCKICFGEGIAGKWMCILQIYV